MAGYSRETERQNKALKSILRGEAPEKRIFITKEDKEFKEKMRLERETEQKRINEKLEATKGARMPWFCPKCEKVMKRKLDNKMWLLYDHCFDCQIKFENKMRIDGTYDRWEKDKVKNNKRAYLTDMEDSIEEWKEQKPPTYTYQVNPDIPEVMEEEKWGMDREALGKLAEEALKDIKKMKEKL
jgi:hypothetical protein